MIAAGSSRGLPEEIRPPAATRRAHLLSPLPPRAGTLLEVASDARASALARAP